MMYSRTASDVGTRYKNNCGIISVMTVERVNWSYFLHNLNCIRERTANEQTYKTHFSFQKIFVSSVQKKNHINIRKVVLLDLLSLFLMLQVLRHSWVNAFYGYGPYLDQEKLRSLLTIPIPVINLSNLLCLFPPCRAHICLSSQLWAHNLMLSSSCLSQTDHFHFTVLFSETKGNQGPRRI